MRLLMPSGLENDTENHLKWVGVFWRLVLLGSLDADCPPSAPQRAKSTQNHTKIEKIDARNHAKSSPEPMTRLKKKHHGDKMWQ